MESVESFFLFCRLPEVTKYKQEALQAGLKDISPYVRKTAVMGVLRLFNTEPDVVESE